MNSHMPKILIYLITKLNVTQSAMERDLFLPGLPSLSESLTKEFMLLIFIMGNYIFINES